MCKIFALHFKYEIAMILDIGHKVMQEDRLQPNESSIPQFELANLLSDDF